MTWRRCYYCVAPREGPCPCSLPPQGADEERSAPSLSPRVLWGVVACFVRAAQVVAPRPPSGPNGGFSSGPGLNDLPYSSPGHHLPHSDYGHTASAPPVSSLGPPPNSAKQRHPAHHPFEERLTASTQHPLQSRELTGWRGQRCEQRSSWALTPSCEGPAPAACHIPWVAAAPRLPHHSL